jgi:NDP-sugar pyrophosphorylase family protein
LKPSEIPLFLLAGGFGTRLSAVVKDVPKPLAPIHGKPFLAYLLENYYRQGIRKFVFLVHHKAELMKDFVKEQQEAGILKDCMVDLIEEEQPMGTGGAIKAALQELPGITVFLVSNADTYLSSGVAELLSVEAPALAAVWQEDTGRYGSLQTAYTKIIQFIEKSPNAGPGLINAGLYRLSSSCFRDMPSGSFSLENTLFPALLNNHNLQFIRINADFIDIGIPEDYEKCKHYLTP